MSSPDFKLFDPDAVPAICVDLVEDVFGLDLVEPGALQGGDELYLVQLPAAIRVVYTEDLSGPRGAWQTNY